MPGRQRDLPCRLSDAIEAARADAEPRCKWCLATDDLVLVPAPVVSDVVPRQHECANADACGERFAAILA